jgi:hypothetical protein
MRMRWWKLKFSYLTEHERTARLHRASYLGLAKKRDAIARSIQSASTGTLSVALNYTSSITTVSAIRPFMHVDV